MENDWSKHIADLPIRVAHLVDALNLRQYKKAMDLATAMISDLAKVCAWIVNEAINKGKQ